VAIPAAVTKSFSLTRSWAIASALEFGRMATRAARYSTLASGTFSNSSVATSMPAAKRSSAPVSSNAATVV